MARLAVAPIASAARNGSLARVTEPEIYKLKVAAAAQVAALAGTPASIPGRARRELIERAKLACGLLQAYGALLRDRLVPWALETEELHRLISRVLISVEGPILAEAPSAEHAQAQLDQRMREMTENARRLSHEIARCDAAAVATELRADEIGEIPDFLERAQALMEQQDLRARWITPPRSTASAPTGSMQAGAMKRVSAEEARATFDLPPEPGRFDVALDAFEARFVRLLPDIVGADVRQMDGPRMRWLRMFLAIETLAAEQDACE
jgi:hypothetical protein